MDDANKNDSSMTAARVDGALRGMRHAAAAQVDAMVEAERAGTRWCEERERGRGLMGTVLRAWREAVEHESSAESRPGAGDELNRTPRRWRERRLTAIEAAAVGPTPGGTSHYQTRSRDAPEADQTRRARGGPQTCDAGDRRRGYRARRGATGLLRGARVQTKAARHQTPAAGHRGAGPWPMGQGERMGPRAGEAAPGGAPREMG